ncbi:MAG: hypothetical protein H0V83_09965 [Rubrobacter sp.]|nr:hypothetical protein [Rubrobacter sp.]
MNVGLSGGRMPFEERRMWRLLLARLHPDVGGDQESFLLASALRAGISGDLPSYPGTASKPSGSDTFLGRWRNTMDSWASDNRETLRGHRTRCSEPSRP